MVKWLAGISEAGKTTPGNRLKDYLDRSGRKAFFTDSCPSATSCGAGQSGPSDTPAKWPPAVVS